MYHGRRQYWRLAGLAGGARAGSAESSQSPEHLSILLGVGSSSTAARNFETGSCKIDYALHDHIRPHLLFFAAFRA